MAQQTCYTTATFRRLPQGETLQIVVSANKAMSILKDRDTKAELPTLSPENALIITPQVFGTNGTQASISDAKWLMDGKDIPNTIGSYSNTGVLTISHSPIGSTVRPITFRFTAKATLNNNTYDVEKSVVLNCAETSQNSYWGAIETDNGTTLDTNTDRTTLTPTLYLGTNIVTDSVTVKWYKTGAGANNTDLLIDSSVTDKWTLSSDGKLTILKDGVDGAAHFEAHFLVAGGEVEAEGVFIVDITDELVVTSDGDQYAAMGQTAVSTIKAFSKNTGAQLPIKALVVTATDSIRERNYHKDYITTSVADGVGKVSMDERYFRVPFADPQVKGQWAIVGDKNTPDTMTTDLSKATECEINLLIGATAEID